MGFAVTSKGSLCTRETCGHEITACSWGHFAP